MRAVADLPLRVVPELDWHGGKEFDDDKLPHLPRPLTSTSGCCPRIHGLVQYQVHRPSPDTDVAETLGALTDLVRQGKVRYIGSSSYSG